MLRTYSVLLGLLTLLLVCGCKTEEQTPTPTPRLNSYYYHNGQQVALELSLQRVLVHFKDVSGFEQKNEYINTHFPFLRPPAVGEDIQSSNSSLAAFQSVITPQQLGEYIALLEQDPQVDFATPCYTTPAGKLLVFFNQFAVRLKPTASQTDVSKLVEQQQIKQVHQQENGQQPTGVYDLWVDKTATDNALELSNQWVETDKFELVYLVHIEL